MAAIVAPEDAKGICEEYERSVISLLMELENVSFQGTIEDLFKNFHQKFTMVPSLWLKWYQLTSDIAIKSAAKKHFYHRKLEDTFKKGNVEKYLFFSGIPHMRAFRYYPINTKSMENMLMFPHQNLDPILECCQKYGTLPLPSSVISKFNEAKAEFISIWGKEKQISANWLENLIKVKKDKNFVYKSFEFSLGICPSKKSIWKTYIKFLEPINFKIMLCVYSRYCRLFVDDLEMRQRYLKELKKWNAISKEEKKEEEDLGIWWIDCVEIERIFVSLESAKKMLEEAAKAKEFRKSRILTEYFRWIRKLEKKNEWLKNLESGLYEPHFEILFPNFEDFKNPEESEEAPESVSIDKEQKASSHYFCPEFSEIQAFSLPFNFMIYIRQTSPNDTLQKLNQSCKFFFAKTPTPLCRRLSIFWNFPTIFFRQSLFLNPSDLHFDWLKGISVGNFLQVSANSATRNCLSLLLTKIQCNFKHLEIRVQNLTEAELNLISGDRIETVSLKYVTVKNSEEIPLNISTIIGKFPEAKKMTIKSFESEFEKDFSQNLGKIKRSKSLSYLDLGKLPETVSS